MSLNSKECNSRLIQETANELKVSEKTVNDCLSFYSEFIVGTIRAGNMEGVTVPYLGKFQVKLHLQQYKDFFHALTPEHRKLLKNAPRESINDLLNRNEDNEAIHD